MHTLLDWIGNQLAKTEHTVDVKQLNGWTISIPLKNKCMMIEKLSVTLRSSPPRLIVKASTSSHLVTINWEWRIYCENLLFLNLLCIFEKLLILRKQSLSPEVCSSFAIVFCCVVSQAVPCNEISLHSQNQGKCWEH